jgi:hypothetical protein
MSLPLALLVGGALFLAVRHFWGYDEVLLLTILLVGAELIMDLSRYRRERHG